MILYRKNDSTEAISNVKITLNEQGWGMPGLVNEDSSVMQTVIRRTIHFDIACSIELRAGSEHGITLPLPFPRHRGIVKGRYDTVLGHASVTFHVFNND